MYKNKKVGIMGGTFDPIHNGHLVLGESAYEQCNLDTVLFMPAGSPPHKKHRNGRASDRQRVDMVMKAIADNPHFEISYMEMNEDGYSYTYRTLETLNSQYPGIELYFICGADCLFTFEDWRFPERIASACTMVTAQREHTDMAVITRQINYLMEKYSFNIIMLDNPNLDISSEHLRERLLGDRSIKYYTPESVRRYILDNMIYHNSL